MLEADKPMMLKLQNLPKTLGTSIKYKMNDGWIDSTDDDDKDQDTPINTGTNCSNNDDNKIYPANSSNYWRCEQRKKHIWLIIIKYMPKFLPD